MGVDESPRPFLLGSSSRQDRGRNDLPVSKGGIMRNFVTALAATALLASLASPAEARRRHHRHHDEVDAGDVVAGAVVIGGIAAVASAIKEEKRRKKDDAVDRCAGEAERRTGESVSEIFHVARRRGYY